MKKTILQSGILLWFLYIIGVKTFNRLHYPDSIHFIISDDYRLTINCSYAPIGRTTWREYLSCKRKPTGMWHPISKCSKSEINGGVVILSVKGDNHVIIPGYSETFFYMSETHCISNNIKMVIHRCDPEAPKCNKCTLPFGIQDGRISRDQITTSSRSSNSLKTDKIIEEHQERPSYGWCAGFRDNKQFLQVDLRYEKEITGVGSWKTDTAKEFLLKYKNELHQKFYYYKEDRKIKLFLIDRKAKGIFSRHWFFHKIKARLIRFQVTKWGTSLCLHVEVYGCDDARAFEQFNSKEIKSQFAQKYSKKLEKLASDKKTKGSTTRLIKTKEMKGKGKNKMDSKDSSDMKNDRRNGLIICFVAASVIGILAFVIVYKWARVERKIMPDYLKIPQ